MLGDTPSLVSLDAQPHVLSELMAAEHASHNGRAIVSPRDTDSGIHPLIMSVKTRPAL